MSSPSSFASLFEREGAGLRAGASHRAATSPSLSISLTRPRPTPPSQMTTNTSGPPQHNYHPQWHLHHSTAAQYSAEEAVIGSRVKDEGKETWGRLLLPLHLLWAMILFSMKITARQGDPESDNDDDDDGGTASPRYKRSLYLSLICTIYISCDSGDWKFIGYTRLKVHYWLIN